ncbi:MAG: CpsD/CapB family tyrosine-protein kinase [Acidobacteriota bacterium]|nr:CpsD/CapB family tyrosine-protein kinase [Acidobacteriota bacterium]MDQ7088870.1 CpsD/CapB family tyrosine-protein kinase [Acidobacteriota bacterium]
MKSRSKPNVHGPDSRSGGRVVTTSPSSRRAPRDLAPNPLLLPLVDPRSPITERYRRMMTHIDHLGARDDHPYRVIVMASSREAEGKTLTAMNLALALAEDRDRKVLLMDVDLHRPRVHHFLLSKPKLGWMDVFEDRAELDAALVSLNQTRLRMLPAGRPPDKPAEVIKSERFRRLLRQLRDRFDAIVLDAPPLMRFVDANILNSYADGLVFVIRAGLTSRQIVRKALAQITSGKVIGVVLNDVRYTLVDRYYYRYDEYGGSYYDRGDD